jgi:hypothetical protein
VKGLGGALERATHIEQRIRSINGTPLPTKKAWVKLVERFLATD